jgi:hypothetical protein
MTLDKHPRSVLALAVVMVVVVVSLAILIALRSSVAWVEPTFTDPVDQPLFVMSPAGRDLQLAHAAA